MTSQTESAPGVRLSEKIVNAEAVVNIVARRALHFVVEQQIALNRAAQPRGFRTGREQSPVHYGQRVVVGERNGMIVSQVGPDGVVRRHVLGTRAAAKRIEGDGSVMTAQTEFRSSAGLPQIGRLDGR